MRKMKHAKKRVSMPFRLFANGTAALQQLQNDDGKIGTEW